MSHMKRLAGEMEELNSELSTAPVEIRRTWPNGPAAIVPEAPGDPEPYDRYSGVDIIADKSFLDQWNAERILDGVAVDPTLIGKWQPQALDRASRVRFVNTVKRFGGAWTKADRGTEFHDWASKVTAAQCRIDQVPDEFRPAVAAYIAALAELELTVVAVERFVVDDERRLAGTFDAMVRDRDGNHFILDIKTGRLYPIGLAMQLYGYAVAPWYFVQGEAIDGTLDRRIAKPTCRVDMAYVAEVDIDAGTVNIRAVDLLEAPTLYRLRDEIIAARKTPPHVGPTINGAHATLDKVAAHFPGTVDVTDHVDQAWRDWMAARMRKIVDANVGDLLARRWPADIPTLKSGEPIPVVDGTRLEQVCSELEAEAGIEFPSPSPAIEPRRPRKQWVRRAKADEGANLEPDDIADLTALYAACDQTQRDWMRTVIDDAGTRGRSIRLKGTEAAGARLTERRAEIYRALLILAPFESEHIVRSVLSLAMDTEVQPGHNLGEAFGSLTIDEARTAARIAQALTDDRLQVVWKPDGAAGVTGDIAAVLAA